MSRILLTGGSGFLGSFIAKELLTQNNEIVFLARGNKKLSAQARIDKALSFVDSDYKKYSEKYSVFESDITQDYLGLSHNNIQNIANKSIDEVWHVAGSVSFSEKDRDLNYSVNVNGTNNLLNFISGFSLKRLFHVSTAFVCGNADSPVFKEDSLDCGQMFNNPYEETKFISEKDVMDWSVRNKSIKTTIFRPSIIVGDSVTGKTNNFTGYYRYMRVYHMIKKKLKTNNNKTLKNGHFFIPINVPGNSDATLNIVPIDYTVDLMMRLRKANAGGTYHLTADSPASYLYWLKEGLRILGITGVNVGDNDNNDRDNTIINLEKRIVAGISDYLTYITGEPIFDKSYTKRILGRNYKESPSATPELIEKLLGYAIDNKFKYLEN